MTTFIVDGKTHTLTMRTDTGVDWSADFIGGYEHGMQKDNDGNFVTDQETWDWWVQAIADQEAIEKMVAEYSDKYGDQLVSDWLQNQAAYETDLDMMLSSVQVALHNLDETYKPDRDEFASVAADAYVDQFGNDGSPVMDSMVITWDGKEFSAGSSLSVQNSETVVLILEDGIFGSEIYDDDNALRTDICDFIADTGNNAANNLWQSVLDAIEAGND